MKKAERIIIPKVAYENVTISEAIAFLRAKAEELDPDKKGLDIVLVPNADDADRKYTLKLRNAPLSMVLGYLINHFNYEMIPTESKIILQPRGHNQPKGKK